MSVPLKLTLLVIILFPNLDSVAPVMSMVFCITLGFLNFACTVRELASRCTDLPEQDTRICAFDTSFVYWNLASSVTGTVMSVYLMSSMDPHSAKLSVVYFFLVLLCTQGLEYRRKGAKLDWLNLAQVRTQAALKVVKSSKEVWGLVLLLLAGAVYVVGDLFRERHITLPAFGQE